MAESRKDDYPTVDEPVEVEEETRRGFLPIHTNAFDRIFISVVILIAIHLLWLRFLEHLLPLGIATIISLVLGYIIFRYG